MDADRRRKEEWITALQLFVRSRLRTHPYAAAARAYPLISVPALIPHTQSLIDGVVWSLNDHPEWMADAWLTLLSHLKDTGARYAELREELAKAERERGETSVRLERRRLYSAHAAVQDLYTAFCVVDAAMKNCAGRELRAAAEKELPALVSDYFPLWGPQGSAWADDAAEEHRERFLGLLVCWAELRLLGPDASRRMAEYIQHRLRTQREEMMASGAAGGAGGSAHGAAMADGLKMLLGTGASITSAAVASSASGGGGTAAAMGAGATARQPRTAEAAERTLRSFVRSIFPTSRSAAGRHRCGHCGAQFRDDASKNAHYRFHFSNHNIMKPEEKVVRLLYPTANEFVEHVGDVERAGFFTKTTDVLEDAYRSGARGDAKVRRLEDVAKK